MSEVPLYRCRQPNFRRCIDVHDVPIFEACAPSIFLTPSRGTSDLSNRGRGFKNFPSILTPIPRNVQVWKIDGSGKLVAVTTLKHAEEVTNPQNPKHETRNPKPET